MKAVVLTAPNNPLELKHWTDPEPGPGQVRLRMYASGLCGTDVHIWRGQYPVPFPIVLGHEPVGVVDMVGLGVDGIDVGDRVGVSWTQAGCGRCGHCIRQKMNFCLQARTWIQNGGGNAELMIAEAAGCTPLPSGIRWEDAAPLFCAGFTVMSGYRNARPRPGERVAVIGIGGLGHLAVQIAKALGHEVVAITSTEDKRAEARHLGADEVLVIKDHAGRELSAMGGADIVLSTSNSMKQNSQALSGLRPEGRFVTMAIGKESISVDPLILLLKQIAVIGSSQHRREDLVDVLALVAAGRVKPAVEVYPIADANAALERLATGQVRYRAVLSHY